MKKLLLFLSIFAFPLSVFAEEILRDTVQLFLNHEQALIVKPASPQLKKMFEEMWESREDLSSCSSCEPEFDLLEEFLSPRIEYTSQKYGKILFYDDHAIMTRGNYTFLVAEPEDSRSFYNCVLELYLNKEDFLPIKKDGKAKMMNNFRSRENR